MTPNADEGEPTILAPDDAFATLGNETRMEILQTLGEADGPLSFSELRDRVGMRDSGQFNYHLGKLAGHFVRQTGEGYTLRQAGRRVIEAVLSGAVTDAPVIERTKIDHACHYCGAPSIKVSYREEQVGTYCPECRGTYGGSMDETEANLPAEQERLGYLRLPPAGVHDRTPKEVLDAAAIWDLGEIVTAASGVCPRCSAPVTDAVSVCEDHDATDGRCDQCDRRYAVVSRHRCSNCRYEISGVFGTRLLATPDLRAFLIDHGFDPVAPSSERFFEATAVYDEEVLGTDPFEARFTFTIDGEMLTVTVDDDLSVVDVARSRASDPV